MALYDIILADPPWKYNQRANLNTRFRGGAMRHYDVMSVAEICAIPVSEIAARDAVLFLWTTWPRLIEAMSVMKAWGFKYKTAGFDWIKLNKNGTPFFGVGFYAKSNTEPCLLGTRGKVIHPAVNNVSMAILAQRREHSRKPDEVAERIEKMYPLQRKIELFARQQRPGWDVWGNEVESDVILIKEA